MTDDGLPLTRRRVLAGLAGAGALGSGAGAFTSATLSDREILPIGATAGAAGISVDCDATDCVVDDGVLQFAFDAVPGEKRRRSFTLTVDDNPVRVWARTDCPPESDDHDQHDPPKKWPWNGHRGNGSQGGSQEGGPPEQLPERPSDPSPNGSASTIDPPGDATPAFGGDLFGVSLEEALALRVSIADPCDSAGTQLYPEDEDGAWGTLRDFQTAFANGRRLDADEPCYESGDDVCLEFEYRLPWWYALVGPDDEADLELELYAEQCRHVEESAAGNPFEPAECGAEPDPDPDPEPCPDCAKLGKLEVEGDRLETKTYDFDEIYGQFEDDDYDYEVDVLAVTTKDDGAETTCVDFRLLRDGEGTVRMCRVDVKGGSHKKKKEKKKRKGGREKGGREKGDDGKHDGKKPTGEPHEIEPPSARTPEKLCTPEFEDKREKRGGPSGRPAISNLVVWVCDPSGDGGDGE